MKKLFLIAPMSDDSRLMVCPVLCRAAEEAAQELDEEVHLVEPGSIAQNSDIHQTILQELDGADVVIADLSSASPDYS